MTYAKTWIRARPLALPMLAMLAMAGCTGHGQYTQDHKDQAQKRVAQMKSATDWDMAHQQFLAGDLPKALASVDRSISLNGEVPKSFVLRGRILIETGAIEQAEATLDRAIALDASNADAHYFRAIVMERMGRSEEAVAAFTRAAESDPGNPQYPLAAAETLIEMNRLDDAEARLTDGARNFEHNAGIRQTLGHIAMIRKDYARAVQMFSDASRLAADDPGLLEDLARAQIAAGRFAEAETTLGWVIAQDKEGRRRDLTQLRARCLIELDRPVEARELLYRLASDDRGSNDPDLWYDLGSVSVMLSDRVQTRRAAQRLIAVAPDRADGYVLMAMWQRQNGDREAALATLRRARRLPGSTAPALEGVILREMGRPEEAAEAFALAQARERNGAEGSASVLRRTTRTPVVTEVPVE